MSFLGVFTTNPDGENALDADNSWVSEIIRCVSCQRICAPSFLEHGACAYCRGTVNISPLIRRHKFGNAGFRVA